jgi:acetylornithine deacetylase
MPLDPALRQDIVASVEAGFPEQVAFTQALVRFPSLRGEEHAIQDFVFRELKARGFAMERFAMDREAIERHPGGSKFSDEHSQAPIVVGIHRPREEKGRSLILQHHVDVVPAGPADMWATRPFEPVVRGDWMLGRGAADMKAGAAANFFALDALRRIRLQPAATVYLQSVVEEESTGNGALMTHLRGYRADAVLIPEPEEEKLVRANTGVLWFQIEVRGHPVHVREMGAGANAIDAAYRIVGALRRLETEWNERRSAYPHFEGDPHPINLNVGRIEGGDWASSVPAWCAGWTAASRSIPVSPPPRLRARSRWPSPPSLARTGSSRITRRGSPSTASSPRATCSSRAPGPSGCWRRRIAPRPAASSRAS